MSETRDILSLHMRALKNQTRCALATVISTDGPSYRSAGARSLVLEDGTYCGGLSAGCLEADIACRLDGGTTPFVVEYDLSTEDDIRGFPFGCGGTVQIFVEPLPNPQALNAVQWLSELTEPAVLLTVVRAVKDENCKNASDRSDGIAIGSRYGRSYSGGVQLEDGLLALEEVCTKHFNSRKSGLETVQFDGCTLTIFAEYLTPSTQVCIFGDGEDARTLAAMAETVGMNVERISRSHIRHSLSLFEEFAGLERSYAVVMTHDLNLDTAIIKQLVQQMPPYIGVMGPRTRTEKILKSIKIDPAKIFSLNNFYAPVGLNLAAETPQEIALSILSEIQTVAKGCELGHLRDSEGAIHNRSEKVLVEEKNSPTKFCSNPTTCNDDQTEHVVHA